MPNSMTCRYQTTRPYQTIVPLLPKMVQFHYNSLLQVKAQIFLKLL